ncbi:MAG: class I SAM-dependent methyltransferase [Roseateles sp.]
MTEQLLRLVGRSDRTPRESPSAKQTFTAIYRSGTWGSNAKTGDRYFSGTGSHDPQVVDPYVAAVSAFLRELSGSPSVVDLGCGDFNVGSKIRQLCGSYTACDIVEELIERNQRVFASLAVDFRVLDMINDDLPAARVFFVRQVLQHLSNADIAQVLSKIPTTCEYLIVTEHLPSKAGFVPNVDKERGHEIRLRVGSGVVLTAAPFELKPISEEVLCEVPEMGGVIRTLAYRLR